MRRIIMAGALALVSSATLANQLYRPDVQVNVPPEVFSSSGQRAQPCSQCCIYQDQNYSEGAVILKRMAFCFSASVMIKRSARIRWSGVA